MPANQMALTVKTASGISVNLVLVSNDGTLAVQDELNRTLTQIQQSKLSAKYHKPLVPGGRLFSDDSKESQNYHYYQINDQASRTASIGYAQDQVTNASLLQSASQFTHTKKFVMGKLSENTTTPEDKSRILDLSGMFTQMQKIPRKRQTRQPNSNKRLMRSTTTPCYRAILLRFNILVVKYLRYNQRKPLTPLLKYTKFT